MKQTIITILLVLYSVIGFNQINKNIKIKKEIDQILTELTDLVIYFDTVESKSDILFKSNISSLKGIKGRLNDVIHENQQELATEYFNNTEKLNKIISKLNSRVLYLEANVTFLKDSTTNVNATQVIEYIDLYTNQKSKSDSLLLLVNELKHKIVMLDTVKLNNTILALQLNEYRSKTIEWGLSATALHDPTGSYYYVVNNDSTVTELTTNGFGGMLSFVLYFTALHVRHNELYGILNIPVFDYSTASGSNLFNKRTSLGFGVGYRFGSNLPIILTAIVNLTSTNRLNISKRSSNDFITEIPHDIIDINKYDNSVIQQPKIFYNVGIVIPIGLLIKHNKANNIK